MPGDAPQPGETPRAESNPWSLADPEPSWWRAGADSVGADPGAIDESGRPRHPRRRPPQTSGAPQPGGTETLLPQRDQPPYAPETADARTAAGRDVARELDPAIKQRAAQEWRTEPGGVERDHNRPDPFRYDPLRPPAGYPGQTGTVAEEPVQPTAEQARPTEQARPAEPEPPAGPGEPDVMVLPEPEDRNRPTVSLDRGPVPGQGRVHPAEPLPRPTGDAATDARLQKLENSPFWLDEAGRAAAVRLPSSHAAERGRRSPRTRPGAIRKPAPALFALIALALLATFFAWVSAEPFWLAVGHGAPGYATTTTCRGAGVTQRCAGRFEAADGSFVVTRVTLLGVADDKRVAGAVTPARMVSPGSHTAYLGSTGLLVHLRWMLGFALVLICGYAIASLTGARRLDDARSRRLTVLASLAAPLVLLAGFLFAAY
jgi:hypothetical protein